VPSNHPRPAGVKCLIRLRFSLFGLRPNLVRTVPYRRDFIVR